MQKIRLAWRGWNRRREERDREFLQKSGWSGGQPPPSPVRPTGAPALQIDIEGLTVAYLDGSGRIEYYLDTQTGDVIEAPDAQLDSARYKRVPIASAEDDERMFIEAHQLSVMSTFRETVARDRTLERAWYNFRSDRALKAIDQWLRAVIPQS